MAPLPVLPTPLRTLLSPLRAAAARLRLIAARRHAARALDHMPQGLCLYDSRDRLLLANRRFGEIYRLDPERLVGTTFLALLEDSVRRGNHAGRTTAAVWAERKAFIDRREPGTFLQTLGDGRQIAILHQPLPDGGWIATYDDITEHRQAEARVRFLAEHDSLTRLPNRRHFEERVALTLAETAGRPCALLFVDLDGFKAVNDTHGHAAGDRLLRQVADRLAAQLRQGDTAARLGGDEFAVLLPGTPVGGAAVVAERIIEAVAFPFEIGPEETVRVGVSIGIATSPLDATEPDGLLFHADKALYAAKRAGRGTFRISGMDGVFGLIRPISLPGRKEGDEA